MIKAIIFDLDGVLVDADRWHFDALNKALVHCGIEPISWQEHLTIYKALPTSKKLIILEERRGISKSLWPKIMDYKQEITADIISTLCLPVPEKVEMMRLLKKKYKVMVCSNAIRSSVQLMLEKSGVLPYIDFFLSNQDVSKPKPDPEIYIKAFEMAGLNPKECIIVEDSDVGHRAATSSGGILCRVSGPHEVNYYRVMATVLESDRVNVVIPAAGQGKRFAEVGYQHPKPFIDVEGRPMIEHVLDNFQGIGRNIILMQRSHIEQYCAVTILKHRDPILVPVEELTEGAACTVLLAKKYIDTNSELIIANSDQYVTWDMKYFIACMRRLDADGGILTFKSDHPKWSYAKYNPNGQVTAVAEKIVISDQATVGIYYYKHGSDFVKYTEQMITKNIRINNEFYVCPVFNEFIADGKRIFIHKIHYTQMYGLGTPDDLQAFLKRT